jgi:hypothetical protein
LEDRHGKLLTTANNCRDKIKGFGKLRILGNADAQDIEVYGDTTINGFLYVYTSESPSSASCD